MYIVHCTLYSVHVFVHVYFYVGITTMYLYAKYSYEKTQWDLNYVAEAFLHCTKILFAFKRVTFCGKCTDG